MRLIRLGVSLSALFILCVGAYINKEDSPHSPSNTEKPAESKVSAVHCNPDPNFPVCVLEDLVDKDGRERIIRQAEINKGYVGMDSLDQKPAMQIDIVEKYQINHPDLYAVIEPYLERLTAFTSKYYDVQGIYWIFLRKYAATGNEGRRDVRRHQDSSGATAVILLNDIGVDFEGGKYAIMPKSALDTPWQQLAEEEKQEYFPHMPGGSAMVHDGTLYHGVRKVTNGTRYSLIVFYNVDSVKAKVTNDLNEPMEIYYQSSDGSGILQETLQVGEETTINTFSRHRFFAKDLSGNVRTKWLIGYSPARQLFRTSKNCNLPDKSISAHPFSELDGVRKETPPEHSEF